MGNALVVSGCLGNRCDVFRRPDRFGIGSDPRGRWKPWWWKPRWWRWVQWRGCSSEHAEHGGRSASFDAHVAACSADAHEQTLVWEFDAAISPSGSIGNAGQHEPPERKYGLEHVSADAWQHPTP